MRWAPGAGEDPGGVVSWLQTNKTGYSPVNAFSLPSMVARARAVNLFEGA